MGDVVKLVTRADRVCEAASDWVAALCAGDGNDQAAAAMRLEALGVETDEVTLAMAYDGREE